MGLLSKLGKWNTKAWDFMKDLGSDAVDLTAAQVGLGKDADGDWEWNPLKHNPIESGVHYTNNVLRDFGIIDDSAPDRAVDEMTTGQQQINSQLDTDLDPSFEQLGYAMGGRDLGSNLDEYQTTIDNAMEGTSVAGNFAERQAGASNPMNVGNYFKNRNRFVGNGTNSALRGSAGGASNSGIGTQQLNQQAGKMWDRAFAEAMGDASNNIDVAQNYGRGMGQIANLGAQRLDAKNQPALDYLQLNNDRAMQRYAGNIGLTQAQAAAAGQSNAWL